MDGHAVDLSIQSVMLLDIYVCNASVLGYEGQSVQFTEAAPFFSS